MLRNSGSRLMLVLLSAAFISPVTAQEDSSMLEEVVVLATKREQTLEEVPIAVSVVTQETFIQAQINDVLDLQASIPSLRVTQLQTTGNTNFIIRGFGNGANNPGIEPSVGVFIDGVYRSRSASALAVKSRINERYCWRVTAFACDRRRSNCTWFSAKCAI